MARARVTATIPASIVGAPPLRVLAQAEGMMGESMRFVLSSLMKQMDDAGIRLLAEGNTELRTITITTELLG